MSRLEGLPEHDPVLLALSQPEVYDAEGTLKPGIASHKLQFFFRDHFRGLLDLGQYSRFFAQLKTWTEQHYALKWGVDFSLVVVSGVKGEGPFVRVEFADKLQKKPEILDCSDIL